MSFIVSKVSQLTKCLSTVLSSTGTANRLGGHDVLDDGGDYSTSNDVLSGGGRKDLLIGGAGDDDIPQDGGADVTLYDTRGENNILRFGAGVKQDNIKLNLGSLLLNLGNGDQVHIAGFDQNDVFNSSTISGFEFADGTTLSTNELLARGFDLDGTADDDLIIGASTTDRRRWRTVAAISNSCKAANDEAIHAWRAAA